ncbi:hypothetical protein Tco_1351809 [Tanacetum coccineum]
MHNNIMAAGSRDRPPMLATGRYAQWRSRSYAPTWSYPPAVPATADSPECILQKTSSRDPQEMWECLQEVTKGESLNIQDVKTNLFWEFGSNSPLTKEDNLSLTTQVLQK